MDSSTLTLLGIIIMLIGFFLIFLGLFTGASKSKVEGSAIFFIGPIPIGWASSKEMLYLSIFLSIIVFLFIILMLKGMRL